MTLLSLITDINDALRGLEDVPASGTDEYNLWVRVANRKKDEWARDPKQHWASNFTSTPLEVGTVATTGTTTLTGTGTYFTDYRVGDQITVDGETVRTIATITSDTVLTVTVAFSNTASSLTFSRTTIVATGVQTYSLNRNLFLPSDTAYVTTTDDDDIDYTVVKPQDRETDASQVHISGRHPQVLTFVDEIVSTDQIVGGTLVVPGYHLPADLSDDTDLIPVDDPRWLTYAVASEIAFNDVTYEDKYVDLNTKANALYLSMIQANRQGTSDNPRTLKTNVKRIRGTEVA